ncbi:invasion associated locus B family protein [Terasakiella sp. A23]|uniref:invasion associated locus B family protein n=1 Tax=Terasakiella sp. FCG-A23 TaxID=3080561 RepID=UPI00295596CE|nr:invasion associated locus B family protein [Terasakiella sp. A23]MDV7339145.1 invasion associated locus B family protein [Terasakiella sp. A23]
MKFAHALTCAIGLFLLTEIAAKAADNVLLKEQEGPWKSACYKDGGVEAPYCRIMIVNVFGGSKKSTNFVQFGLAFDRGRVGFVFATYHGFAPESKVKVKIDNNERHVLQTSKENHTISPDDMGMAIFEQMKAGKSITVDFKLSSGITRALDFSLEGFKTLYPDVQKTLAGT